MSERIAKVVRNVDHAFDVEARTAQNEWDEYLDSRQYYQDDKGRVHDSHNGHKFAKADVLSSESEEDYYNRLQSEGETEGPFAGKSLKEIAQMVREARAASDKTLETDARAAFDDTFMAMAEKYNWQGTVENADGTTTDRNAIADQKLAYYESIMDGTADMPVVSSEAKQDTESADDMASEADSADVENSESVKSKTDSEETPLTEADQAELNKKLAEESDYTPRHRAEYQDEESPIYDELKKEVDGDDAGVKESESLEEFEDRQPGKHRKLSADDLEMLPVDETDATLSADDLELLPVADGEPEDVAPKISRWRRYGTPTGIYNEVDNWNATRERGGRRRNRMIALLGGAALAAVTAGLLARGHDIRGHGGGFGNFLSDIADKAKDGANSLSDIDVKKGSGSGIAAKAHELFGNGIVDVRPGDGYTQVIDRVLDGHNIHLSSKELYNLHQHLEHTQGNYIDLSGAPDTYVMQNGDNGLTHPDTSAHVSEATQKAVVRWLEARGKI